MKLPELKLMLNLFVVLVMVTCVPGIATAQIAGAVDFCDPNSYDNATGEFHQTFGAFTDLYHYGWRPNSTSTITYRPDEINVYRNLGTTNPRSDSMPKPRTCAMNFFGNPQFVTQSRAEMWITILGTPTYGQQWNSPPASSCWGLEATVWFDNAPQGGWNGNKGVGIITNFDTVTKKGLLFALYDAGNTESLRLQTFDASPSYPDNIMNPVDVASVALRPASITSAGGGTRSSFAYVLGLDICSGPDQSGTQILSMTGSVQPELTPHAGTCPRDPAPDQQCLTYHGPLPTGIPSSGAAGLAAVSPTNGSFVDVYVALGRSSSPIKNAAAIGDNNSAP